MQGRKDDADKPDPTLVPALAEREVWAVLTYGARHYSRDNWRKVPDGPTRYLAAALRHVNAYRHGEENDPESGKAHLGHAIASLLFVLEQDLTHGEAQEDHARPGCLAAPVRD